MYYNIYMRKNNTVRPNTSIRIDPEILHKARIEAVKAKVTIGEWLEAAIKEKIKREPKNT
jgi:predicted HicB family RNase H-like nuclease